MLLRFDPVICHDISVMDVYTNPMDVCTSGPTFYSCWPILFLKFSSMLKKRGSSNIDVMFYRNIFIIGLKKLILRYTKSLIFSVHTKLD